MLRVFTGIASHSTAQDDIPEALGAAHQVHVCGFSLWAHFQGGDVEAGLAELEAGAKTMIDDLLWWTAALKTARAGAS